MLARLKSLLADLGGSPRAPKLPSADLTIAAAALLVEAARADHQIGAAEVHAIVALLMRRFQLDRGDAEAMVTLGTKAQAEASDLYKFTRLLKDRLDNDGRVQVIEMLWEVAYADGRLDDYEAALLRRVGGLLYVSDSDRGSARQRVLKRLGLDGAAN